MLLEPTHVTPVPLIGLGVGQPQQASDSPRVQPSNVQYPVLYNPAVPLAGTGILSCSASRLQLSLDLAVWGALPSRTICRGCG